MRTSHIVIVSATIIAFFGASCQNCVDCFNCYQLNPGSSENTGTGKICEGDYHNADEYVDVVDSLRKDGCVCK